MIVVDASALLAFLYREPGGEEVASHLADACLSTVNLAEVLGRVARDGGDPREVRNSIAAGRVEIVPFSAAEATIAATLLPTTRRQGLSLADRACLSLGMLRRVPVLTADRSWADLVLPIEVKLIRWHGPLLQ